MNKQPKPFTQALAASLLALGVLALAIPTSALARGGAGEVEMEHAGLETEIEHGVVVQKPHGGGSTATSISVTATQTSSPASTTSVEQRGGGRSGRRDGSEASLSDRQHRGSESHGRHGGR